MDNICDNAYAPFRDRDVVGPAGLAEYVLLEDYQLFRAGEDVPFEELCLAEPLACVIRSIHKAAVGPADNVVVVGAGIMGILHVILAKRAGARVLVSEPNGVRSAFALGMGADAIIDPTDESFVDKVKAWTAGRGADAILCAVSVGAVLEQAVEAVAKGGRVHVFASIHPRGTRISIDPNPFHSREIVLTGTMSQDKDDMRQAVEMISRGSIDLKPFISHMVPLKQLEEGLKAALRPDTYRVVVRP
jgi:L-iditol 2-dehydrogenase